ncbi:hypothetical protein RRG08_038565 [Elysia crispata]|uniref:Uncharacterized protein n=1 Tax=Elysia crispata TaxID=231223 RepID=A0AAE0YGH5_9GAST|nr:hypothetical protein RRG08_038565 [Elysia crispata]
MHAQRPPTRPPIHHTSEYKHRVTRAVIFGLAASKGKSIHKNLAPFWFCKQVSSHLAGLTKTTISREGRAAFNTGSQRKRIGSLVRVFPETLCGLWPWVVYLHFRCGRRRKMVGNFRTRFEQTDVDGQERRKNQ